MNQFTQQFQMAKQAYASGKHSQAVRICDQLTASLGARDDVLNIKAVSLLALGQVEAARVSMKQALKLNPNVAGMHLNAAGIYKALSLNKQTKRHAMTAVRLAPRDASILYQAALICRNCDDYPQALRIIERCLQVQPGFGRAWHLKGSALIDLGRTEEAQAALEKSVELEPGNVGALSALVKLRGDSLTDSSTIELLEHIRRTGTSSADRGSATYILGNMHRHEGQYDTAFALYLEANALVASSRPFDFDAWEERRLNVMRTSAQPGALTTSRGNSGANLVFIIGMPRSGTTLCEQVLSASPGVLACGELATMANIEGHFVRRGIDPYQCELDNREIEQAAALYLSALPKNHHEFRGVTDKAPMNFERVGFIHRLFPQARFLYCIRHPLDTILSCLMQDFQIGLTFASDLEHIAKTYIAHAQLMQHWMKLLPGQIHTVCYEQYVANQEAETRGMTEFLQIDFEQDMMTPHLQERAVGTASNLQVRQAVYSSSIGRWKNYQPQLAGVIALLQKEGLLNSDLNYSGFFADFA